MIVHSCFDMHKFYNKLGVARHMGLQFIKYNYYMQWVGLLVFENISPNINYTSIFSVFLFVSALKSVTLVQWLACSTMNPETRLIPGQGGE